MKNNDTVFIYPTDTVWGIGGSIWSQVAYDKVCDIKGTGRGKPLSIIVSDEEMLNEFVKLPAELSAEKITKLISLEVTLAFHEKNLKKEIPHYIYPNSDLVGFRVARDSSLASLIKNHGEAITSTSLNFTGESPIVNFEDAREFFHQVENKFSNLSFEENLGRSITPSGQSSSFVVFKEDGYTFLRKGRYASEIEEVLGLPTA